MAKVQKQAPKDNADIVCDEETGEIIDTTVPMPPLGYAVRKFAASAKLWLCVGMHACVFFGLEVCPICSANNAALVSHLPANLLCRSSHY